MRPAKVAVQRRAGLAMAGILLLGLGLRLAGISLESFWADEAFTAAASQGSVLGILETNARDIHPPAYYLGLHAWRFIVPEGDVGLRLYSTAWSLLGILFLMILSREVAGARCALFAGLFMAVNPLDVYFAQEARMYAQTTTLGIAATLCLWRWWQPERPPEARESGWRWGAAYVAVASLLLLTHYIAVTFLIGQGIVALTVFAIERDGARIRGFLMASATVAILFAPWLLYVLSFRDSIVRVEGLEWMPIPAWSDYLSFTWNEYFWGRIHRHAEPAPFLAPLLPASILALGLHVAREPLSNASKRRQMLLVAGHLVVPLLVCAIVSASYQVVYYRPRYSVILLPYFLVLVAWACSLIRGRALVRAGAGALIAAVMLHGTILQTRTPQKRAWRETAASWPAGHAPAFYVILPAFHQRSLAHYLDGEVRHTPRNVLERLSPLPEGALIWVASWPEELAPEDAAYRDWLKQLGAARHLTLPSYYSITQLEPRGEAAIPAFASARFRSFHRPFDVRGQLAGFSNARNFEEIQFDAEGRAYRWSAPTASLRLEAVAPGEEIVLKLDTGEKPAWFSISRAAEIDPRTPPTELGQAMTPSTTGEIRFTAPPGNDPLTIRWTVGSDSDATRGLRIEWIGIAAAMPDPGHVAQRAASGDSS